MRTKKIKSNFKGNIHLACGNDELRPVFHHVFFKDGYAMATNAHVAIRQRIELMAKNIEGKELLEGKCIHAKVFARILRADKVIITETGIMAIHDMLNYNTASFSMIYPFGNEAHMEVCDKIMKVLDEAKPDQKVNYSKIGVSFNELTTVQKAMIGSINKQFVIHLPSNNVNSIIVTSIHKDEDIDVQKAIIMPVSLNED